MVERYMLALDHLKSGQVGRYTLTVHGTAWIGQLRPHLKSKGGTCSCSGHK